MRNVVTQRFKAMPREARDSLLLLGVIAWIVAPHTAHLPLWCSLGAAGILAWRAWGSVAGQPLPSRWVLVAALLVAVLATLWSFRTLIGRDAGVTLVVVLLALKTLELKARRDAFVVFFLGFFAVMTNFFYSQTLLTAAAMFVAVLGLLTALVNAHTPVGRPPLSASLRAATRLALFGTPVMVMLFVLFPRLSGPLWSMPQDDLRSRTGLSDTMTPGSVAELATDDSIVLRVKFDQQDTFGRGAPPSDQLYFRGPVLARFDGRQWSELRGGFDPAFAYGRNNVPRANLQTTGPGVKYEVTQEPTRRGWLFPLELTPQLQVPNLQTVMKDDLQWLAGNAVYDRVRYRAEFFPQFTHGPLQPLVGLQDYVELPAGFNPRTLDLAMQIRRDPRFAQADATTLANHLFGLIRTGGFTYTLEPGTYGDNQVDEFWFDRKLGFCEHYASAFVVLMRALDVPARVVTGFQGAELNGLDGFWEVRNTNAHAWAEYWQAGRGWVRADPTAAVAPDRIRTARPLIANPGFVQGALGAVNPDIARRMREAWSAVNNSWNQWVLNYSQSRQLDLLRNLGLKNPDWADLSLVLLAVLVAVSSLGAVWAAWDVHRTDPWLRAYRQLRRQLAKLGVESTDATPPGELLRRGQASNASPELLSRLQAMQDLRYRPGAPTTRRGWRMALGKLGTLGQR
jgi:protein-glutamine gamma-glutamyltransferase